MVGSAVQCMTHQQSPIEFCLQSVAFTALCQQFASICPAPSLFLHCCWRQCWTFRLTLAMSSQGLWRGVERSSTPAPRCSTSLSTVTAATEGTAASGRVRGNLNDRLSPRGTTVSPERTIRWARWDAETPTYTSPQCLGSSSCLQWETNASLHPKKSLIMVVGHHHILHVQTQQTRGKEKVHFLTTQSALCGVDWTISHFQCSVIYFYFFFLLILKECQGVKE